MGLVPGVNFEYFDLVAGLFAGTIGGIYGRLFNNPCYKEIPEPSCNRSLHIKFGCIPIPLLPSWIAVNWS